ncbi:amino acid permease, partial [Chloroflexota bacterium]
MSKKQITSTNVKGRFGTFTGVFTPNVLTILGIILFLRTGWVVGQAGLVNALIIVGLANSISLLTGLSLSSIATSMRVKTGGNYFMISRTLGLEIGGAIGVPLYLSQAISVAFYIIGFTEALLSVEFFQAFDPRLIATMVALVFGVVAFVGADIALKIQFFILGILAAALVSFFTGGWHSFISPTVTTTYSSGVTFWVVFAIFFPAVTGIEAGTSLSGDLKNPGRSIPVGTITSIVVTALVYFASVFWFSTHTTPEQLINDNLVMQSIASVPFLILLGVWAATLSSALGSILAAPRTLQALASDEVAPRWMGSQMGSPTEPRMAVLLTTAIAVSIIWLGDLNVVAPIISMFFLNTYGMTNLVAGIERFVGNPSFRPRLKIPWYVSILGALGCYGAMFLINPLATVVAIVISYSIFFYLRRRAMARTWGDVRSGIWFSLARYALLNLEGQRFHVKNWRPNILVFTGQPHNRERLVLVAEWLTQGQGIVTFAQVLVGDVEKLAGRGLRETARKSIRKYIQDRHMAAFADAQVVSNFNDAALTIVQSHGVGGLEPNAVMLGWSGTPAGQVSQLKLLRRMAQLQKSVLLLNYDEQRQFGQHQVIDVWWGGRGGNAGLMLILAYLIRQHRTWYDAKIRLIRVINSPDGYKQTLAHMEQLLARIRVTAEVVIICREDPHQPLASIISEQSRQTDLTVLGMQIPDLDKLESYSQYLDDLMQQMGSV